MKHLTYPYFRITCTVNVHLPENTSYTPDVAVKQSFLIRNLDEIHRTARRDAIWTLERLGVDSDKLKLAEIETDDHSYIAIDPKGVKREYRVPVEAFCFCEAGKKRATLIRQRRLVPDDLEDMVAMYGQPVKAPAAVAATEGAAA